MKKKQISKILIGRHGYPTYPGIHPESFKRLKKFGKKLGKGKYKVYHSQVERAEATALALIEGLKEKGILLNKRSRKELNDESEYSQNLKLLKNQIKIIKKVSKKGNKITLINITHSPQLANLLDFLIEKPIMLEKEKFFSLEFHENNKVFLKIKEEKIDVTKKINYLIKAKN